MWGIDRFNARAGNTLSDATRSMVRGSHSSAEVAALLVQIDRDKSQCTGIIRKAIVGSWIGYANAMGMVYQPPNAPESRQIVSMDDLRSALRQLQPTEMIAALYFITGYTRDVLYKEILLGITHQEAVEDYVMHTMCAKFAISRSDMKAGHKTCVGILYGKVYNNNKQKLMRAILPKNVSLAVGRHGLTQPNHWKRPKHLYFVHTTMTDGDTASKQVSHGSMSSAPQRFTQQMCVYTQIGTNILQVDIRHTTRYLSWRSGVALKLYAFQMRQSNQSQQRMLPIVISPTTPLVEPVHDDASYDAWDLEPLTWDIPTPPSPLMVLTTAAQTMPRLDVSPPFASLVTTPNPPSPLQKILNTMPASTKTNEMPQVVQANSRALGFMKNRPGGPVQEQIRKMQVVERQVAVRVQKKCTASSTGRNALVAVAVTMNSNNKKNKMVVANRPKRKSSNTIRQISTTKQRVKPYHGKATTVLNPTEPSCRYGCKHIGWVELLQMTTNDTKHYLGEGNFFDRKSCTDCNISIASLFETSKQKALFYYCPVDFNVSELDDDNSKFAANSCACILCIPCYFGRETKMNATATTRKSGRGRKQQQTA